MMQKPCQHLWLGKITMFSSFGVNMISFLGLQFLEDLAWV